VRTVRTEKATKTNGESLRHFGFAREQSGGVEADKGAEKVFVPLGNIPSATKAQCSKQNYGGETQG